jgi:hypothetical protein
MVLKGCVFPHFYINIDVSILENHLECKIFVNFDGLDGNWGL